MPSTLLLLAIGLSSVGAAAPVAQSAANTCGDGVLHDALWESGALDSPWSAQAVAQAAARPEQDGGLSGLTVPGYEACDDGNTDDGDGCSSTCTVEPAFVCDDHRLIVTGFDHPDVPDEDVWDTNTTHWGILEAADSGAVLEHNHRETPSLATTDLPLLGRSITFEITPVNGRATAGIALGYNPGNMDNPDADYLLWSWTLKPHRNAG